MIRARGVRLLTLTEGALGAAAGAPIVVDPGAGPIDARWDAAATGAPARAH